MLVSLQVLIMSTLTQIMGYVAHAALQRMHNTAIEKRTNLQLSVSATSALSGCSRTVRKPCCVSVQIFVAVTWAISFGVSLVNKMTVLLK